MRDLESGLVHLSLGVLFWYFGSFHSCERNANCYSQHWKGKQASVYIIYQTGLVLDYITELLTVLPMLTVSNCIQHPE